jgi:hypothetical protein
LNPYLFFDSSPLCFESLALFWMLITLFLNLVIGFDSSRSVLNSYLSILNVTALFW